MRKHGIEKGGDESLSSCGWFESGKTTGVEERKKGEKRKGQGRKESVGGQDGQTTYKSYTVIPD